MNNRRRSSRASNQNLSRQRSSNNSNSNNNNNNSNSNTNPLPTLDLHGLHREAAIRRVTDFLEEHSNETGFVRIVTGSGSHSPSGPVLKNEVQDLLMRRQMIFTMARGSFQVDPRSGTTFYPPPLTETDSKVIVVGTLVNDNNDSDNSGHSSQTEPTSLVASMPTAACASLPRRHVSFNGVPAVPPPSSLHRHHHHQQPQQQSQNPRSVSDSADSPPVQRRTSASTIIATAWKNDANHNVQTPDELDPDDDHVQLLHAREASLESARQELWNQRDHNALDRALQASRQEYATEIEHEETLIEKAIALSQEQETAMQQEEERLLKQVLEESQRSVVEQSQQKESEEERLLRQALKESELDVKLAQVDEKDEEDALKEALSRSLQDVQQQPTILSEEEEERMIRKAMAMSLEYRH